MKFKELKGKRVKLIRRIHGDTSRNPVWGGKCGKILGTVVRTVG